MVMLQAAGAKAMVVVIVAGERKTAKSERC
jgi:hypothetical protein